MLDNLSMSTKRKPKLLPFIIVLFSVVMIAWVLRTFFYSSRAAGANASISLPSSISVMINNEFDIPVSINTDDADIIAADMELIFDRSYFHRRNIIIQNSVFA